MLSYLYLPISSERPSRRCYRERIPARQERVSGQSVTPTSSIVTDRRISWHARASRANKVEKAVDQCSSDSSNSNNSFLLLPRGRHPRSRNHHAPTAGWCGHPVTSVAIRKREQFRGNSMARETAPARFRTRARKTSPEREIAVAVAGSRIIWSFAGKRGIVTEFRRVGGPSLRRIGAMINGDHAARARARARETRNRIDLRASTQCRIKGNWTSRKSSVALATTLSWRITRKRDSTERGSTIRAVTSRPLAVGTVTVRHGHGTSEICPNSSERTFPPCREPYREHLAAVSRQLPSRVVTRRR